MNEYLARYYERGTAYAMRVYANSFGQAKQKCIRNHWVMEEDAAKYNP